jgi:hypothetical protein
MEHQKLWIRWRRIKLAQTDWVYLLVLAIQINPGEFINLLCTIILVVTQNELQAVSGGGQ